MYNSPAIHFKVMVGFSLKRRAILTFFGSPLRRPRNSDSVQFNRFHDPPGLLLVALLPFLRVMILPCPADHLPQQFLSKRFLPVTPTPPNPSVFPPILRPPALLHPRRKLPAASRAVLRDAVLPQQPV